MVAHIHQISIPVDRSTCSKPAAQIGGSARGYLADFTSSAACSHGVDLSRPACLYIVALGLNIRFCCGQGADPDRHGRQHLSLGVSAEAPCAKFHKLFPRKRALMPRTGRWQDRHGAGIQCRGRLRLPRGDAGW
jgi:hypothetical protein